MGERRQLLKRQCEICAAMRKSRTQNREPFTVLTKSRIERFLELLECVRGKDPGGGSVKAKVNEFHRWPSVLRLALQPPSALLAPRWFDFVPAFYSRTDNDRRWRAVS